MVDLSYNAPGRENCSIQSTNAVLEPLVGNRADGTLSEEGEAFFLMAHTSIPEEKRWVKKWCKDLIDSKIQAKYDKGHAFLALMAMLVISRHYYLCCIDHHFRKIERFWKADGRLLEGFGSLSPHCPCDKRAATKTYLHFNISMGDDSMPRLQCQGIASTLFNQWL